MSNQSRAETLGEVIAGRRSELGLSRRELAESMQTSIRNVERWENDQVVPRGHHFWLLMSALSLRLTVDVDEAPRALSSELNRIAERVEHLADQVAKLRSLMEPLLSHPGANGFAGVGDRSAASHSS
jgi:transcriptional regulator with XRE-family HTH domain